MGFNVNRVIDANTEIRKAVYPSIRLFTVPKTVSKTPLADCKGHWLECSPKAVSNFSAVAYFFGRDLYNEIKQPVGLIHSSWGGTIAEAWMSLPKLQSDAELGVVFQVEKELAAKYPNGMADYNNVLAQWQKDVQLAEKENKTAPFKPFAPVGQANPNGASLLYNGMIVPIIPYAIKGVIWYQGESNAERPYQYRKLFPALIADWRTQWHEGDFPFYFVQLANYNIVNFPIWPKDSWPVIR
jgi:sialate O-acetylesterase